MKTRVLFIIHNLAGGGAEKVLINILNNIDYNKFTVDLFLTSAEGIYLNKVNRKVNIKSFIPPKKSDNFFHRLNRYFRFQLFRYFKKIIAKLYIGHTYDIEIAFLEGPTTELLSKSTNNLSKKIGWIHTDLSQHRTMSLEKEKSVYESLDKIVCVSNQSEDKFLELHPEFKEKVEVIYNLIDKKEILNKANEQKCIDLDVQQYPTIIAVGRLIQAKRFDILIKAHKLLIDEGINCHLTILGEGHLRSDLEKLVQKLKTDHLVFIPGFIKNPYPYIKEGSIYAMSSDYEGLPLVIAEALTLGKPIVSTDCVGPTELLGDSEYGLISPRGNEHQLKDSLKRLLIDNKLKESYEKNALKRSEIFDKEEVMKKINNLLDKS